MDMAGDREVCQTIELDHDSVDGSRSPFKSVNSKLGLPSLQRTLLTIEVCGAGPLGGVSIVWLAVKKAGLSVFKEQWQTV